MASPRVASLIVRAPAKVNLDLRILGRRPDGNHEVRTILQSVELHDTVRLTARDGPLTVRSRAHRVPSDRRNIVWTAARALWAEMGRTGPVHGVAIDITKRVPMAAGLGGGSSDAASALRGLCVLWGFRPGTKRLDRLAATLGADVTFFLYGGLALGTGRGNVLRRLPDIGRHWVVLAVPTFEVSSRAAYGWFAMGRRHRLAALPRNWRTSFQGLTNDLQEPVTERHPSLSSMVGRLQGTGAVHAAMTGSGSTVFGLYTTRHRATAARRAVRSPGWRTTLTRTVSRTEFVALARVGG